jgi:hypothetical protein
MIPLLNQELNALKHALLENTELMMIVLTAQQIVSNAKMIKNAWLAKRIMSW